MLVKNFRERERERERENLNHRLRFLMTTSTEECGALDASSIFNGLGFLFQRKCQNPNITFQQVPRFLLWHPPVPHLGACHSNIFDPQPHVGAAALRLKTASKLTFWWESSICPRDSPPSFPLRICPVLEANAFLLENRHHPAESLFPCFLPTDMAVRQAVRVAISFPLVYAPVSWEEDIFVASDFHIKTFVEASPVSCS